MTQKEALQILKTGANVFLTGEPGAGKTHTINEYVAYLRESGIEPAITASTGIAATHVGGMTIHSWSGIGIKSDLDEQDIDRISSTEYIVRRVLKTHILIIDEVSMLPPNTLNSVDAVCRAIKQRSDPFGGMQVIFVGDFFQLPPVTSSEKLRERNLPDQDTLYIDDFVGKSELFAFGARAWERANPVVCYLSEQYRQDDEKYLSLLSAIRTNSFEEQHLDLLEKRKVKSGAGPKDAPKLFSHNLNVDTLNTATLAKLPANARSYKMKSQGAPNLVAGLIKGCLSPEILNLKVGASVMFTKNNPKEEYVNGTLGEVIGFDRMSGFPMVKTRTGFKIEVTPMDWSLEEGGKIRASITQLPLRLAWAITVHKSQGMSLDEAVMDLSGVFEYGQGYVALSRVRRLSGLHIVGWNKRAFEVHPEILEMDATFREMSQGAQVAFDKIPKDEIASLHRNFVSACGGKVDKILKNKSKTNKPEKGEKLAKIRQTHPNAYRSWSKEEDEELKDLFLDNITPAELSKKFGRNKGAIHARLLKLGLIFEE